MDACCAVQVESRDISVAGRILAQFPDLLRQEQRVEDHLTQLGELAKVGLLPVHSFFLF